MYFTKKFKEKDGQVLIEASEMAKKSNIIKVHLKLSKPRAATVN